MGVLYSQEPVVVAVVVPNEVPSAKISTVELDSAVPAIMGVLSFVVESSVGDVMTGFAGAAVSIVKETASEEGDVLLAESVAVAVRL